MDIRGYVNEVRRLYASGQTTEHSFRPALAKLFASVDPTLTVINEPKHITDVGAPDFVFNRGDVAIGWCEAKDIGKDIRKFAAADYSKAQKDRYKKGLPNLIYTNGLDFEFIREGDATDFVTIADLLPGLPERTENFVTLENRLRDFASETPLTVTSSKKLAQMMAGKAALIKDIMGRALVADIAGRDKGATPTDLIGQFEAFRANLIHDITVEDFADIYAETIAYGLFAARLHDESASTFSRSEALDLLPKSNPFLRELFIYIAGPTLDERLRRVIDELCDLFRATSMHDVLENFGKVTARQDPFLHFYEVFLAEYNPAKRKARGVWYTPEPVVNFIVRAVDEVLQTEFGLADGLADTSKITIDWDTGQTDKKGKPLTVKKQVHRVQILDPATGTGTFLAEVVKVVAERVKGVAPGQWSTYVEHDLIPRIHGFELLMASYAMCHMKLDMILTGLGYKPSAKPPRLGVYLTNSLEEGERVEQTLFGLSRAIAEEAKAASDIKRQTPIMCVIGNPPYSGISQNNSPWISEKIEDYKYIDGVHFRERKHWLQDDYVKFIRLAEHMIEMNGEGIIGFITNHGYLDNPTFNGMRSHILKTFDKIYIIDLHGNSKKREISPSGAPDKNVFDIQAGTAIIIGVKKRGFTRTSKNIYYADIWGSRSEKYESLFSNSISEPFTELVEVTSPSFLFKKLDNRKSKSYSDGFSLKELFINHVTGVQTSRDNLVVDFDDDSLSSKISKFVDAEMGDDAIRETFFHGKRVGSYLPGDSRGWSLKQARRDLNDSEWAQDIQPIAYRPLDKRSILYRDDMIDWPRKSIMRNFKYDNIGLVVGRQGQAVGSGTWNLVFCHDCVSDLNLFYRGGGMSFPLYIFPDEGSLDQSIQLNFSPLLFNKLRKRAGLSGGKVVPNGTADFRNAVGAARTDEVKVFDYIYGILHCPAYREAFAEFLKVDFPRIPYPPSPVVFNNVSASGEALRRLHLVETPVIGSTPYPFHGEGDSIVGKTKFERGRVWVNNVQFFENVPETAWTFSIGGYQPAQKWLKDRKGRTLSFDDIRHYQKIIKILAETHRIMGEIDLQLD